MPYSNDDKRTAKSCVMGLAIATAIATAPACHASHDMENDETHLTGDAGARVAVQDAGPDSTASPDAGTVDAGYDAGVDAAGCLYDEDDYPPCVRG